MQTQLPISRSLLSEASNKTSYQHDLLDPE
jgi:MFS family permease